MARTQRSIQAFTRISKPASDVTGSRKRKQIADEEPLEKAAKKSRFQLLTPPDTPTKAIKHVLSNLRLSMPTPSPLKSSKRKRAATPEIETPPTPDSNDGDVDEREDDLPDEIEDLKNLQHSFLKALALHYAHNGAASPVDVRALSPTVTKTWGKRKVMLDDMRICLGITCSGNSKTSTSFTLSNYGNGKICIEMESRQRKRGVLAQAFDEAELIAAFEKQLELAWKNWAHKDEVAQFVASLPRARITECSSFTKLKPSLAKGQQRLEEVLKPRSDNITSPSKRPQYRQFPAYEKPTAAELDVQMSSTLAQKDKENTTPPPPTANFRALSLLDRIQKKQELQTSNLANRPSKAAMERAAALQRTEEMVQILEMLATTKGPGLRASFPLPALIRSVQSSLRSTMSADEIERCIAVIGKEVAPGYVEMKVFGSMKGVVVNRMFKPDAEKVRVMVEEASA